MTRRIAVGLLALTLVMPFPVFAQAGAGDLRPQIEKLVRAWQDAYDAGDAAAVAALYTTDAKLLVPGAEPGSGPKAIQDLIAAEPGSGPKAIQGLIAADIALGGKLTLTLVDVVGFGDYALETGRWVATSPDDGKHLDHGPYLVLYKKTGGGWKMNRDIWNSSMPSK
jgi:uncharacterized protein (TIGR02246 family)